MKKIGIILLSLFLVGLITLSYSSNVKAASTTYYISSSGDDSNSGLAPNAPWKSLDKIFYKSYYGVAFQPGDKILLKSGDTFNGQIRIKATGTSANPISVGAYDTGAKPIVVGEVVPSWAPVTGFPNIYVTSVGRGSVITPAYEGTTSLKTVAWNADLTAFLNSFTTPGSYGPVNTDINDKIYLRTLTDAAPTSADRLFRSGTVTIEPNSSYIKIENLNIQRGFNGVDFNTTNNITISNLNVQDTLGIGIYSRTTNNNCLVENNSTLRTGNDGIYFRISTNCVARNNTISTVTNNIVGIPTIGDQCGLGLEQSQNSLVEGNKLDNSKCGIDYFNDIGSEVRNNYLYLAGGIMPQGTNMKIHNNIINQQSTAMGGTNAVESGTGKSYIYNNTYYNTPSSGYGLMGSSTSGQVIFYNNVVHAGSHSPALVNFGANVLSDYNSFYTTGSPKWRDNVTAITYTSLSSYQAASGKEAHSFFGNPLLANTTDTAPQDFKLQAGSPCKDKGFNLVSAGLVPAYSDFEGVSIPQGSNPDMGAYEYVSPNVLNLIKSVDKTTAVSGEILTYTIQYSTANNITNARIEDPIPSGTTFVFATNGGISDGTKVIWNLGNLAPGANGSVSFQVSIN